MAHFLAASKYPVAPASRRHDGQHPHSVPRWPQCSCGGRMAPSSIVVTSSPAPLRFLSADSEVVLPTQRPHGVYSLGVDVLALNGWLAPTGVPRCSALVAEFRERDLVLVSNCSCK